MRCRKCGSENNADANFCRGCGNKLETAEENEQRRIREAEENEQRKLRAEEQRKASLLEQERLAQERRKQQELLADARKKQLAIWRDRFWRYKAVVVGGILLSLVVGGGYWYYQTLQTLKDCDYCPELVVIPSGSFVMGSPDNEAARGNDEGPQRTVSINYALAVGKFEVTQGQWRAVMGNNPSYFKDCGDQCPVESVSWNDAQEYIKRLNSKSGQSYRLLTEAEWEYAARAGTSTHYHFGNDESGLANYAWYGEYSSGRTHPAGQKQANAWGLYDMHGNVWEWVQDCYANSYANAPTDGKAQTQSGCDRRVRRGGSWNSGAHFLRSAFRDDYASDIRGVNIGFRIARTLF